MRAPVPRVDSRTGGPVALKFFDPDFHGFRARYRMDLFARECKLLERLVNKPRCLQLVQPLSELRLSVPGASPGRSTTIDCGYCVLEWLGGDITEYFLRQDEHDALVKLALLRQAVLGVFALTHWVVCCMTSSMWTCTRPDSSRIPDSTTVTWPAECIWMPSGRGLPIRKTSFESGTTSWSEPRTRLHCHR